MKHLLTLCLLAVVAAGGCAEEGPSRYHVSGTVTYQGEPVRIGSVIFQPDPTAGNSGPSGNATVRDGKFDTREEGTPTIGGPHIVIIEAFDGKVVDPDYAPHGTSLGVNYRKKHNLPKSEEATLNIELTER